MVSESEPLVEVEFGVTRVLTVAQDSVAEDKWWDKRGFHRWLPQLYRYEIAGD